MISRRSVAQYLSVALCIGAAFVSYKLLAMHLTGSSGSAWFDAGCEDESPKGADCEAVLATPHSYFPPKQANEPPGRLHIPVAFLGLLHFSTLAVWLIGVGSPSRARRWLHGLTLIWVLCGLLSSVWFTYIMFTQIDEWCPWCLVTHVMNLFVVIGVILLWPGKPRKTAATGTSPTKDEWGDSGSGSPVCRTVAAHPSWARVCGTIGAMLIVAYGNFGQSGLLAARRANATLQRCLSAVTRFQGDVPRLVNNWKTGKEWPITVRSDDPIRPGTNPGLPAIEVIVFSDFECPSCNRFALFFDEQVRPLFAGRVDTIFKHYPMERTCNAHVSRTLHPNACTTARITEAARLQGASGAFWRAHDLLFSHSRGSDGGEPLTPATVASILGLDPDRFVQDMESDIVTRRIEEDTALGRVCAVRGTPAVFVKRKRVDPLAASQLAFWDRMADLFWKEIGEVRPPSSQVRAGVVTRGSPGPPDAP